MSEKPQSIILRNIETGENEKWTIEQIVSYINAERNEEWIPYDQNDWRDGWSHFCEGNEYQLISTSDDPFPNGLQYRLIPEGESVVVEIWESDEKGDLWELVSSFSWWPKTEGLLDASIDCLRFDCFNKREEIALEWFKESQENK
jgi:hypothetical protein